MIQTRTVADRPHVVGHDSVRSVRLTEQGVSMSSGGDTVTLHRQWLRERSQEPGQVDPTNRQRLFTPRDVAIDLAVTSAQIDGGRLVVAFSDGHVASLSIDAIERAVGWAVDEEEPPAPEPWTTPLDRFPYVDWDAIGWSRDDERSDAVLEFLEAFYRHGYVVLRNTPVEEGTVRRLAERLGYIVGNNFGEVFDVRAEPKPTDLAYTSIELLAHSDQPYRQPVPGIQMLHCLRNEAPGGDSTLVDGLAAAQALEAADPAAHTALIETEMTFRYDMVTDTVVSRGHMLEYDRHGRYRQIRFNTKLDEPNIRPGVDLDAFYRGRRWLAEWLNDPTHQVTFRLEPGDVMFMDNHRALHGRTSFDSSQGHRHLQGAYIDHDGPDTMYRLAIRRRAAAVS
ncbi:MAG: TauD/TfdA family dioxygenase [Ilumatobacteraceae bacterium]